MITKVVKITTVTTTKCYLEICAFVQDRTTTNKFTLIPKIRKRKEKNTFKKEQPFSFPDIEHQKIKARKQEGTLGACS